MYFQAGFPTRKDRDRHSAAHNRSFKCPIQNCHFGEVGFITQADLNTHLAKIHDQKVRAVPELRISSYGNIDLRLHPEERTSVGSCVSQSTNGTKQVDNLLTEAVKSNNFDYINEYWSLVPKNLRRLLRISVQYSSMEMLQLLLKQCVNLMAVDRFILNYASKFDKVTAAHKLIENGALPWDKNNQNRHSDLYHAISNRSPDMIALLLKLGCRDVAGGFGRLIPGQKDDTAEDAAMRCFELLDEEYLITSRQHIRTCFKLNAEKCFSIRIARFLLEHGAEIDAFEALGYTALYTASGTEGKKAAKFMEFLLKSGAKPPTAVKRLVPVAERPGPRLISRWLGMTWHELLKQYLEEPTDLNDSSDSVDP
jgi:ankyrin repeat protein